MKEFIKKLMKKEKATEKEILFSTYVDDVLSPNQPMEFYREILDCYYDDFFYNFDVQNLALTGMCQVWNRKYETLEILKSMEDLKDFMCGYDNVIIFREKAKLHINLEHHDGTHRLEIRKLNSKGIKYVENNDNTTILSNVNFLKNYTNNFFIKGE